MTWPAALVRLRPGEEGRVARGHPWIFANEVESVGGEPESGSLVRVAGRGGEDVAFGFFNPASRVRVRLLARSPVAAPADAGALRDLLRRRIAAAVARRADLGYGGGVRLVFGEADGAPGLVVDRYAGTAVVQLLSAGMERLRGDVVDLVKELAGAVTVVERSDTGGREREGLPPARAVLKGALPPGGAVWFEEGGLVLPADVLEGQKTGFYLDQRDSWLALRPLARGRRVLDLCAYTGAFGLSCLKGGAADLLGIESSARAVGLAREAAARNGLADRATFRVADAGVALRDLAGAGERFGLVVLDPSAFARTRAHRGVALKAYAALNAAALGAVAEGGFLFTCSCTPWVGCSELSALVVASAARAGRTALPLEVRGQARDHPPHPLMPETRYLTGLLWHVA